MKKINWIQSKTKPNLTEGRAGKVKFIIEELDVNAARKFYRLSTFVPGYGLSVYIKHSDPEFIKAYAQALTNAIRGEK